jgi:hypothetical protein
MQSHRPVDFFILVRFVALKERRVGHLPLTPISEIRNLSILRVTPISRLGVGAGDTGFGRPMDCHY